MAKVEANISISLDGLVTGPNLNRYPGLGEGGEILHAWGDDGFYRSPCRMARTPVGRCASSAITRHRPTFWSLRVPVDPGQRPCRWAECGIRPFQVRQRSQVVTVSGCRRQIRRLATMSTVRART
jgi:hypothetical protein